MSNTHKSVHNERCDFELAIAFTGNKECESRSFSEFALDKNFSAVGFDDLFHDSETKTHTTFAGGVGFRFVEESSEPDRLDTCAGVAYPTTHRLTFVDGLSADRDLALDRIPQRIREKILEDLPDEQGIREYRQVCRNRVDDANRSAFGQRFQVADQGFDERP